MQCGKFGSELIKYMKGKGEMFPNELQIHYICWKIKIITTMFLDHNLKLFNCLTNLSKCFSVLLVSYKVTLLDELHSRDLVE